MTPATPARTGIPAIRCSWCHRLQLSSSSSSLSLSPPFLPSLKTTNRKRYAPTAAVRASFEEREPHSRTPYEVLGVPPSASAADIKRAYRRLALKLHPDVNKHDPRAQEKFMRIKHAYSALLNSQSRSRRPYSSAPPPQQEDQDPFYGLVDFLRDLQEEFRNWEADLNREEKPKSLWEELSEIGEEFVEFLEKELNVNETYYEGDSMESQKEKRQEDDDVLRHPSVEESIDEVEAALAQLKKELGL